MYIDRVYTQVHIEVYTGVYKEPRPDLTLRRQAKLKFYHYILNFNMGGRGGFVTLFCITLFEEASRGTRYANKRHDMRGRHGGCYTIH